jgi:hypothetical protein
MKNEIKKFTDKSNMEKYEKYLHERLLCGDISLEFFLREINSIIPSEEELKEQTIRLRKIIGELDKIKKKSLKKPMKKISSYQKLKLKNEQLMSDIYYLVCKDEEPVGMAIKMRYSLMFDVVNCCLFGNPTRNSEHKSSGIMPLLEKKGRRSTPPA